MHSGGQSCDDGLGILSQSRNGMTASICFNSSSPPCREAGAPCCILALQPEPVCFNGTSCNVDVVCVDNGGASFPTILPPSPITPAAPSATFADCGTPGQACCIASTPFSDFGTCFGNSTCDTNLSILRCLNTATCSGSIVGATCISALSRIAA